MESMIFLSVALQALVFLVVVAAVLSFLGRRSSWDTGRALRSLFRYGMLLVLLLLVGTGVTGLLALADPDVVGGPGYTAFMLACVIIAGPGLVLVARWVMKALGRSEEGDTGWEIYLVVAELLSLGAAAVGAYIWAEGLIEGSFRITPAAVMVVWAVVWFAHHSLAGRRGRRGRLGYGVLLGCAAGLVTGSVFGIQFLEEALGRLYELAFGTTVIVRKAESVLNALIGLVIWGMVWLRYWWFLGLRQERSPLWRAYVLLLGVVGGLITGLVGVWLLAYRILDWLVGGFSEPAGRHFMEVPLAVGLMAIGGLVWRYHRTVLQARGPASRSEVDRIHEYTVAGVGLAATVGGLAAVIAVSVGLLVPGDVLHTHGRSDLVAAVTVLLVGAPLWWRFWTATQRWRRSDPESELRSPTRRVFLICVFGAGGVLALVSLFVLAYRILESILEGDLGPGTVFAIRWPLALAVTVGVAAAYHRVIRRDDLADLPQESPGRTVRSVVLVGSGGHAVAAAVEERTGVKPKVWERADTEVALSTESVVEAIESAEHEHLLIVAGPDGQEVIPYTQ